MSPLLHDMEHPAELESFVVGHESALRLRRSARTRRMDGSYANSSQQARSVIAGPKEVRGSSLGKRPIVPTSVRQMDGTEVGPADPPLCPAASPRTRPPLRSSSPWRGLFPRLVLLGGHASHQSNTTWKGAGHTYHRPQCALPPRRSMSPLHQEEHTAGFVRFRARRVEDRRNSDREISLQRQSQGYAWLSSSQRRCDEGVASCTCHKTTSGRIPSHSEEPPAVLVAPTQGRKPNDTVDPQATLQVSGGGADDEMMFMYCRANRKGTCLQSNVSCNGQS